MVAHYASIELDLMLSKVRGSMVASIPEDELEKFNAMSDQEKFEYIKDYGSIEIDDWSVEDYEVCTWAGIQEWSNE